MYNMSFFVSCPEGSSFFITKWFGRLMFNEMNVKKSFFPLSVSGCPRRGCRSVTTVKDIRYTPDNPLPPN